MGVSRVSKSHATVSTATANAGLKRTVAYGGYLATFWPIGRDSCSFLELVASTDLHCLLSGIGRICFFLRDGLGIWRTIGTHFGNDKVHFGKNKLGFREILIV